ncbi:MAG: hypothetical protein KJ787_09945 [Gammaproteobacteria bacterium]|nr:hypothetical protein [Gammaproteobacteria bacterium]MBU1646642.1 hypothetical protein [Gammaproteobacteria bacterium]MBU1972899.1 hypothetical protein [Gammaproteobacteria bacterium]
MNPFNFPGLGEPAEEAQATRARLQLYINLKLSSSGQSAYLEGASGEFLTIADDLLKSYREKSRLLTGYLCPPDQRIQSFLDGYLAGCGEAVARLPENTLILDRPGVARELSLPIDGNEFSNEYVTSYRIRNGVLNNPASDRRTTKGSFHICDDGLPVPGDKKAVPRVTFARLLREALNPPEHLLRLPFTVGKASEVKMFVSLLLRPLVCPEIPGFEPEKRMEVRFFAPGSLVSNLDFVESIFGNGGNPVLAQNDAGLDIDHWSGHSGCVILAPHLNQLTKQALGLPRWDDASERQRADGMCWRDPAELYNEGSPFKITARDERGVIVTVIADNYYGYCKKEVKTQISYAANLFGLAEEEHAGGALTFERRHHGDAYNGHADADTRSYSFADMVARYGAMMEVQPQGYAIDNRYPEVIYLPLDASVDLPSQTIAWQAHGQPQSIKLRPGKTYIQPNGYKLEMQKHPGAPSWRLVGTDAEGIFCHKPCTVSGGGKSEISKSLGDAVIYGPLFIADIEQDLALLESIFAHDFTRRFKPGCEYEDRDIGRAVLSHDRSLGSVIRMLTPSPSFTDDYNAWLAGFPDRILAVAFIVKRMYRPEWGKDWRRHFSVDFINGQPGHELKVDDRKLVGSYLRIGFEKNGAWRVFKLRQDFIAAEKVQMEDDISASVVVPSSQLPNISPDSDEASVKLVVNCEKRLFQRPDEAIHRGHDKQTEQDISRHDNFIANFEPLRGAALTEIVDDVAGLGQYSEPMRRLLCAAQDAGETVVSSAHPRMVDGKPSKNPRYLQLRPDLNNPLGRYVAEVGARLQRSVPLGVPVCEPVNAVLVGRRNNPPEPGIRPLAVFNPIHYQELPELFMDFVCSLTGKSPSTTGAGSEGALTKGPFNALRPTADLNNALVAFILAGHAGFSTAAGHIGPHMRVDHDVSLLIPEIWARLPREARHPDYLIENGQLERIEDFDHEGRRIEASRLGWRITERFVHAYLGKIFDAPHTVFGEDILRPETQDMAAFVDGIDNIVEAQRKVALTYLADGSIADACPPLQALLHIMAEGSFEGRDVHHPEIRAMFSRKALLASDWYQERLETKQARDIDRLQRQIPYLRDFLGRASHQDVIDKLDIAARLALAEQRLAQVRQPGYLDALRGTLGADPMRPARRAA